VPLAVTQDVHYLRPDQGEIQAILHAVHRGKASVDDAMREWNYKVPMCLPETDNDLFYRLRETGLSRQDAIDAIINTGKVAERLNVTLPKAKRLQFRPEPRDLEPW